MYFFSLYKHIYCYGSGTLIDDLYCFDLDAKFVESIFLIEHSNHIVYKENFASYDIKC